MFSILISSWGFTARREAAPPLIALRKPPAALVVKRQPREVALRPGAEYTPAMRRLVALGLLLAGVLAPLSAWAQGARLGMSPAGMSAGGGFVFSGAAHPGFRPPAHRPPAHRPPLNSRPPFAQAPFTSFGCCADFSYFPPDPTPPMMVPAPPIVYIVPAPPTLVYVPPARVEPAPEIILPTGVWARHGNGKEYPYTWVWQPSYSAR